MLQMSLMLISLLIMRICHIFCDIAVEPYALCHTVPWRGNPGRETRGWGMIARSFAAPPVAPVMGKGKKNFGEWRDLRNETNGRERCLSKPIPNLSLGPWGHPICKWRPKNIDKYRICRFHHIKFTFYLNNQK